MSLTTGHTCSVCQRPFSAAPMPKHKLLVGDSRDAKDVQEQLFDGDKAAVIWTDPPYGVDYSGKNEFLDSLGKSNSVRTDIGGDTGDEKATYATAYEALKVAVEVSVPGAACYVAVPQGPLHMLFVSAMTSAGFTLHQTLAWVKSHLVLGRSDYQYKHEIILYGWKHDAGHSWYGGRGVNSVFEVDKPHKSTLAPTMKPLDLIQPMIANSSRMGQIVYDPFGGSLSTLIASERVGRRCFTVELDTSQADIGIKRWEMETGQPAQLLFRRVKQAAPHEKPSARTAEDPQGE